MNLKECTQCRVLAKLTRLSGGRAPLRRRLTGRTRRVAPRRAGMRDCWNPSARRTMAWSPITSHPGPHRWPWGRDRDWYHTHGRGHDFTCLGPAQDQATRARGTGLVSIGARTTVGTTSLGLGNGAQPSSRSEPLVPDLAGLCFLVAAGVSRGATKFRSAVAPASIRLSLQLPHQANTEWPAAC